MRHAAACAFAWLVLFGRVGYAQPILRANDYASPQRWAFELRLGPYYPDVDAEFAGTASPEPHQIYFGKSPRLMTQIELDFQFFRGFGTAAVGASAGYFNETARAFAETGLALDAAAARSGDQTSLRLIPLALLFVYRFDLLAERAGIPIVPYAKLGLGYTLWTVFDGNGKVARFEATGDRGRGGTPGWQAAAGVAFLLDVLDAGAARDLDTEIGINHTYLFAEAARFDASGLGRKHVLRVGDTTWLAGLLLEF